MEATSPTAQSAPTSTPATDLATFTRFVGFFSELFARPGLLDGVPCRDSFKEYVPKYYARTFGRRFRGLDRRHLKWFRRLEAVRAMPRGSRLVDFGGGYGMDAIFLAALGYDVVHYEITLSHIAIATFFRQEWETAFGPIQMRSVLATPDGEAMFGPVDAVLFDEVAHHIEPVEAAFRKAAELLTPGGRIVLMEPNFLSLPTQLYFYRVRGFDTVITQTDPLTGRTSLYGNEHIRPSFVWTRIARACGFAAAEQDWIIPWGARSATSLTSRSRRMLEAIPVVRHLLASHVTYQFVRL